MEIMKGVVLDIPQGTKVNSGEHQDTFVEGMRKFVGKTLEFRQYKKEEWFYSLSPDIFLYHKTWIRFINDRPFLDKTFE